MNLFHHLGAIDDAATTTVRARISTDGKNSVEAGCAVATRKKPHVNLRSGRVLAYADEQQPGPRGPTL